MLAPDILAVVARTRGALPYGVARGLLEAAGVRFCREATVTTPADAVIAADRLGYPVVVKGDAQVLTHKTEAGAVRTDVATPDAVRAACDDMRARLGVARFVILERIGPGVEILIGARRDPTFGAVVAAGAGGILTEALRDVSLRLAPVSEEDAREMLAEGARARLLAGPRGLSRDDDGALVRALLGVSGLMIAIPRLAEIDLNPMIVARGTALAVDALVIVD